MSNHWDKVGETTPVTLSVTQPPPALADITSDVIGWKLLYLVQMFGLVFMLFVLILSYGKDYAVGKVCKRC